LHLAKPLHGGFDTEPAPRFKGFYEVSARAQQYNQGPSMKFMARER
jgi:hypothetical protein